MERIKLKVNQEKWEEYLVDYEESLQLFITNKCNLRCPHCFSGACLNEDLEMDFSFIRKIIEANPQIKKINLQGGEPLIHPDINGIIRTLNHMGRKVSLYTNGVFLDRLETDHKNLRVCVSFQSIDSKDSCKPIDKITENIKKYQRHYPFRMIMGITNKNKKTVKKMVQYIDDNFEQKELTIGLIREETDYWNDNYEHIISFKEYHKIITNLLNTYGGKLNLNIFTKGVLFTEKDFEQKNKICRFKNIFKDGYTSCLFQVANGNKEKFSETMYIPKPKNTRCKITGENTCLCDIIYLKNKIYATSKQRKNTGNN